VLRSLGDKVRAKEVAVNNDVPIIQSNTRELDSIEIALEEAKEIGYPVMLKAASGGGGRGMRVIRDEDQLRSAFPESKRRREMPLEMIRFS
jgi:pyruvate carboxylase